MITIKLKVHMLACCLGTALHVYAAPTISDCQTLQLATCPKPVDTQLPDVKDMLTWNQQQRVKGFRNDYRSYYGDVFKTDKAQPIPRAAQDLSDVTYHYQGNVVVY